MPCEHGRRKSRCKECGGVSICEHNRERHRCKECGGTSICEHNRERSRCKECGGTSICEHNRRRSRCKECGGVSICEHGRQKSHCKKCGGASICEHNRIRSHCKECGGASICEHNRIRSYCKECGGTSICEHNRERSRCKECGGVSICEHNRERRYCKTCGGSALCKSSWCATRGNKKYNGYCLRCCIHLFPEIKVARNYKTKETAVVEYVQANFTGFSWITDHTVQDGCSRRRPDLLADFGSHIVIVEVDENRHETYDCSCENKRLMELSQDVHHRSMVFIRFNPDSYIDSNHVKHSSCWKTNQLGIMTVSKQEEWNNRLDVLGRQIQYWSNNCTDKTIEVIELFFNE